VVPADLPDPLITSTFTREPTSARGLSYNEPSIDLLSIRLFGISFSGFLLFIASRPTGIPNPTGPEPYASNVASVIIKAVVRG